MSPISKAGRSALAAGLLAAALLRADAVSAVVGGRTEAGPRSGSAVMIVTGRGMCSAVVVAADAVLTAAHCVAGPREFRVHHPGPSGEPVLIAPAAVATHPEYRRDAVAARARSIDLALVRLPGALPGRYVPQPLAAASPGAGTPVGVGGYGVAREGDSRSTGTFRLADLAAVEPHGPSRILLWAAGSGAGACEGDSGGPLFGPGGVVAVTSWAAGNGKAGCGSMTQGILLGAQRAWIDRTLSGWGRAAEWR